ncbi:interferon-induced protein with tetratricopeptide repeats 2-like [Ctenodactylus gundi]
MDLVMEVVDTAAAGFENSRERLQLLAEESENLSEKLQVTLRDETPEKSLESCLQQLKCHFTWNLLGENSIDEFEDRVFNKYEFENSAFKVTMCNLSAFIKHYRGQSEAALECLQQAEEFIQQEYAGQADIRSVVTWGNYAWVYYHMGRLAEAQAYLDKVQEVCAKFSSSYKIESPQLDCEEGWARLKSGRTQCQRAKGCFEKALEKSPKNPEFTSGWAIASFRLEDRPPSQDPTGPLKKAIELNPDNQYIKALLALKLQKENGEEEGEKLIQEALKKTPDGSATDVLRSAAKFYRNKKAWGKAIVLLRKVLEHLPNNAYVHYHIGCCYRSKIFQILNTDRSERYEPSERLLDLTQQAVHHLKKVDEISGNLFRVWPYLASVYALVGQHQEADYYFQKEFSRNLSPASKQVLHLRYGNFQLYQVKCEHEAIHHFLEGVKISYESKEKAKMESKLLSIAQTRLSKDEEDSAALQILATLQELKATSR